MNLRNSLLGLFTLALGLNGQALVQRTNCPKTIQPGTIVVAQTVSNQGNSSPIIILACYLLNPDQITIQDNHDGTTPVISFNGGGGSGSGIPVSNFASLPLSCSTGSIYYVTDATTSTGGLSLFGCISTNTISQFAIQADGTGYLTVTCSTTNFCLVGANTSVVPSLPGTNIFTGANDFSNATKFVPPITTVGSLPSASSFSGAIFVITDGMTSSDCTTGGGSTVVMFCRSDGSAWSKP